MGADMCYTLVPDCKITSERRRIINQLIIDELNEDMLQSVNIYATSIEKILAALDKYFEFNGRRDVAPLYIKNHCYFLSGGMSWGDPPTDAYETMSVFTELYPLWDQMEKWMMQDNELL